MNTIIAIVYAAIVFVVSVVPTPEGVDPFPGFDKAVHFGMYGLMGIVWSRVFIGRERREAPVRFGPLFVRVVALTFFFGLFIELVQSMTPAREASLYDALANGLGGAAGAYLYFRIIRLCRTKEGP